MAKKITISLLLLVIILSLTMGLAGCKEYGNMPFELQYGADNSVARMPGDKAKAELINNPHRGFSVNLYMTLDTSHTKYTNTYAFPNACEHEGHTKDGVSLTTYDYIKNEMEKYKEFAPQNVVVTIFLTNFIGNDIADNALEQIYSLLRELRNQNLNATVKFAYQHGTTEVKPSVDEILKHMDNLGVWFKSSYASNIVKNSVHAFRLSFVGEDGNFYGHGYTDEEIAKISDGFAKMIPTNKTYYTEAPNVAIKNSSKEYGKLINMGFYNDNFANEENSYLSGGLKKTKKDYKQYVYQSRTNFNEFGVVDAKDIDGKAVLRQLKDGYFSIFDISSLFYGDETNNSLLKVWSETIVTKQDLTEMNLPFYNEWFLNSDGTSQNRYVLDYLRDFLGYNLSVTNLSFEKGTKMIDGKEKLCTTIKFTLTNYGMSAPLFIDSFELYIKNNATNSFINNGNGLTYPTTYDPRLLVSGGQINFEQLVIGDIDRAEGNNIDHELGHSIGIKLYQNRSPRDLYVRLSNDVPYTNNINWIYSTTRNKAN